MKRTNASVGALALAGLLTFSLTACGSDNATGEPDTSGSADAGSGETAAASLSGTLNGGGSSAQGSAQQAWVAGFQSANPDATVNYSETDSGAGRQGFLDGSLQYGGTDAALSEDELAEATSRCSDGAAMDLPVYVSPIAVAFNLEGVDSLDLSADVVAQIFDGKITTWDDPAIAEANPDATLPSTAITPVHRSDDSGTSKNFADYLSKAAPDSWTYEVSSTWPVSGGQSAQGTSGVIQTIGSADGTIGYADLSKVGDLATVALGVGEEFVAPSADAAAITVDASPRDDSRADGDIVIDIDRTTTESGAYPAILVSYIAVCDTYETQEEADLVKGYLSYVVSAEGQEAAAGSAGSAPVSDTLRTDLEASIEMIGAAS